MKMCNNQQMSLQPPDLQYRRGRAGRENLMSGHLS